MIELLEETPGNGIIPVEIFNKLIPRLNQSRHTEISDISRNLSRERVVRINNLILLAKCSERLQSYIVYDIVSDQIYNGYLVSLEMYEQFKKIKLSYLQKQAFQDVQIFQPNIQTVIENESALMLFEYYPVVDIAHLSSN